MLFRLLFPGVIFHELAHYIACIFVGVEVHKVKLFDLKEAYVQHAAPGGRQSIAITLAPFALNNILGLWLLFYAHEFWAAQSILAIPFYWLSVSLIFHSFPSVQDAMNAFNAVKSSCLKRIREGTMLSRLAWALASIVIFIPVLMLTGAILVIDKIPSLQLVWLGLVILFSAYPQAAISLINNLFI